MKYSIRGNINTADGSQIVNVINNYPLWRFITNQYNNLAGQDIFFFEVWVNDEADKDNLFTDLKGIVTNGVIDWHECSHDEPTQTPCVIEEEWRA